MPFSKVAAVGDCACRAIDRPGWYAHSRHRADIGQRTDGAVCPPEKAEQLTRRELPVRRAFEHHPKHRLELGLAGNPGEVDGDCGYRRRDGDPSQVCGANHRNRQQ